MFAAWFRNFLRPGAHFQIPESLFWTFVTTVGVTADYY